MTDRTQPEALRLADELEFVSGGWGVADQCCAKLRRQHARIAELESELEAVGAGGVSGPLIGRAAISANAGEPRALNPRHIRKFLQALQAGEMSVSRAVEILDAWVGGYYEDEMVPLPPPDSCLIADDEFPMEIVRKLRSELAATPPTAQAEGWISVAERLPAAYVTVLLTIDGKHITTGEYMHNLSCFSWDQHDDETDDSQATHWMPLPPPPTSAEGVEHG